MTAERKYRLAVCGATGAVGQEMVRTLEQRGFPVAELRLLASARSAGQEMTFRGRPIPVGVLGEDSFAGCELALFSAGAEVSRRFSPLAAAAGCAVVDNSSAFRREPDVPLVVPEVNRDDLAGWRARGIIANPNCSTIQLVVVLKPLADAAGLRRVVVSSYQSVSGAGRSALAELDSQITDLAAGREPTCARFPRQIAYNCLPHIDVFEPDGYTREEHKLIFESRKILHLPELRLTATTVRIPVRIGHSEAVNVETERKLTATEARSLLADAPGVRLMDDPAAGLYPTALDAAGGDDTLVGRIREDSSTERGLDLWIVADNLRKGAALNAVQILEQLVAGFLD